MAYTPEIDLRDSLVGNNIIINGDMAISQRGTSFTAVANAQYTLDRWQYGKGGSMVHTISQDTDVPTLSQSGYQFTNSLRLNLTTADDSIASTDFAVLIQRIEGHVFRKIAGKPFTLSFWVKSTTTGIRTVAFRNSVPDRSYVAQYTINSANTWEKKTINVSTPPSSGTWNYTTGQGLDVTFALSCGTSFHTTANTWQTGNFIATSSIGNGTATGSTDFRITGVMLNEGVEALPFNLAGGDFLRELQLCQRYYEKSYDLSTALATSTSSGIVFLPINGSASSLYSAISVDFKVRKRVPPGGGQSVWDFAGNLSRTTSYTGGGLVRTDNNNNIYSIAASETSLQIIIITGSGLFYAFHWAVDAEFT